MWILGPLMRLTMLTCAAVPLWSQTPPTPPLQVPAQQRPTATPPHSDPIAEKMRLAFATFQQRKFSQSLEMYREIVSQSPDNVVAFNMIGNCAQELKDYPTAISGFKRALELMPDEWHNVSGLLKSYALSGMTKERDAELQHVRDMKRRGVLPENFSYVREMFELNDKKVFVSEFYPDLGGHFHYRYWFNVLNADDQQLFRIALESDDADQWSWAKEHPKEASEGKRKFSLDTYSQQSHGLIKFYEGEPEYAKVRADVEQVIVGKAKPVISTTPASAPSPATNTTASPK